jgi:uncharacterized protein YndB with AHSA1/START domain
MASCSTHIRINATKEQVWAVLSDFGGIYRWNPGVRNSFSTSDIKQGTHATRRCELLTGDDYLDERVLEWVEGESFKVEIYETNLPLHKNIVAFSIEPTDGGTIVTVTPDYALKYGPVGWLMDRIMVRQLFNGGMEDLLSGLKYYVETGEVVGERIPGMAAAVV